MKIYEYGDIKINEEKIYDLITELGPGTHTTFDFLLKYQGGTVINKGVPVYKSWNGNFGQILAKYCSDHPKILGNLGKTSILVNGRKTECNKFVIY